MTDLPDLSPETDEYIDQLAAHVGKEQYKRSALRDTATHIRELQEKYLTTRDGAVFIPEEGAVGVNLWPSWIQPTGAHDAYPQGYVVRLGTKLYRNDLGVANAHKPKTTNSGWLDVTTSMIQDPPPPGPVTYPTWSPTATYKAGDIVTFTGTNYVCVQGHKSQAGWTPAAVPSLWSIHRA